MQRFSSVCFRNKRFVRCRFRASVSDLASLLVSIYPSIHPSAHFACPSCLSVCPSRLSSRLSVCMHVYLFGCPSVCLPASLPVRSFLYPSVCLSGRLTARLSACIKCLSHPPLSPSVYCMPDSPSPLSLCVCQSVFSPAYVLPTYLPVCLPSCQIGVPIYLSIYLPAHSCVPGISICLPIYLSICLPVYPSVCPFIHPFKCCLPKLSARMSIYLLARVHLSMLACLPSACQAVYLQPTSSLVFCCCSAVLSSCVLSSKARQSFRSSSRHCQPRNSAIIRPKSWLTIKSGQGLSRVSQPLAGRIEPAQGDATRPVIFQNLLTRPDPIRETSHTC